MQINAKADEQIHHIREKTTAGHPKRGFSLPHGIACTRT